MDATKRFTISHPVRFCEIFQYLVCSDYKCICFVSCLFYYGIIFCEAFMFIYFQLQILTEESYHYHRFQLKNYLLIL